MSGGDRERGILTEDPGIIFRLAGLIRERELESCLMAWILRRDPVEFQKTNGYKAQLKKGVARTRMYATG